MKKSDRLFTLWTLVESDFKRRYAGSALGVLWVALQPLLYMALLALVFYGILRVRFGEKEGLGVYLLTLLCGIVPWATLTDSLTKATASFTDNAPILRNTPISLPLVPFSQVISGAAFALVGFFVIFLAGAAGGTVSYRALLLFPLVLASQVLFAAGLALLLACWQVFFKDLIHLAGFAFMGWLYVTPIFYPPSAVPGALKPLIVHLNPLACYVEAYRSIFAGGAAPAALAWTALAAAPALTLLAGAMTYRRLRPVLIDYL